MLVLSHYLVYNMSMQTDPTYMIRAVPSNASDNVYCTLLAHSAIHGAMAGYSGFTVGPVNGRHTYIPINVLFSHSFQSSSWLTFSGNWCVAHSFLSFLIKTFELICVLV